MNIFTAGSWFQELQALVCNKIEELEALGNDGWAEPKRMTTPNKTTREGWHQEHKVMYGDVFEKGTVNFSNVTGEFNEDFAKQIPGTKQSRKYKATGISIVLHFRNPKVPAMHFNTRMIETGVTWYGGGFDVTPCIQDNRYKKWYHNKCKEVCDKYDATYYEKFSKACDEYFYLPHRQETRGIGGLFFEYNDPEHMSFDFIKDVGKQFMHIMESTVIRHYGQNYTQKDKDAQLIKRGRYVEFNLMYDRGTKFGLHTGGNMDAILMSLPPEAKWK